MKADRRKIWIAVGAVLMVLVVVLLIWCLTDTGKTPAGDGKTPAGDGKTDTRTETNQGESPETEDKKDGEHTPGTDTIVPPEDKLEPENDTSKEPEKPGNDTPTEPEKPGNDTSKEPEKPENPPEQPEPQEPGNKEGSGGVELPIIPIG